VDFHGEPAEAADLFEALVTRMLAAENLPASARDVRFWSLDEEFHGVAELPLTKGARCVVTVSPRAGVDESVCRTYRATAAVTDCGDAVPAELASRLELGKHMPFTATECQKVRREMPLTRLVPDLYDRRPLEGYTLIFTIHHMTDFLALMESAFALGADPEDVTVIDKEYLYLHTDRVDAHLKLEQGVRVYRYSDLEVALAQHIAWSERCGKQILVLDDGGYVLPTVMRRFPEKASLFAGLVEQTMSGIWELDGHDLPLPVFSVAESQLKGTIESYGVADAAVRNVLARVPHEKLEGRNALVMGYGRIGQEVASILRFRRMQVAVHDRDLVQLLTAHERGFKTSRDLAQLVQQWKPLLIFGCAGANSMTREHFAQLTENCYLVSTTSRDYEFRLPDLSEMSVDEERLGRVGTLYKLAGGVEVMVLAHGLPINFYYAESLPNRYVDLVLASMLVGACTLALDTPHFVAGHNRDRTNRVLAEVGLLERYYDLYGGRSSAIEHAI
jgi:S-adenosylhomocysteine hydrolase